MAKRLSKLERTRRNGDTQVDYQRANILAAAERVFLAKGLENTSMSDIAAEAGITRASLYRYFPDRDPIAFEIASRMLRRIAEAAAMSGRASPDPEQSRVGLLKLIDQFDAQRDAHRFLGMFDHLYSASYPTVTLAAWYKERIWSLGGHWASAQGSPPGLTVDQVAMIGNCVMSFLQKMAARGDLLADEQGVPLARQLALFREMIDGYFERSLAAPQPSDTSA